jgi:hypothetical protein
LGARLSSLDDRTGVGGQRRRLIVLLARHRREETLESSIMNFALTRRRDLRITVER